MTTFRCLRTWSAHEREFTTGETHSAPDWIALILARAKPALVEIVGGKTRDGLEFELVSQA